jgi:hypothetical protein
VVVDLGGVFEFGKGEPDGDIARESKLFEIKVVEGDIVMSGFDEVGKIMSHCCEES